MFTTILRVCNAWPAPVSGRWRLGFALLEQAHADESDPSKDDHRARARGGTVTDC
jgi:hypothetical protein